MILVTVGTHEQPFNRLVRYMDEWAGSNKEEVVIQTGFSTYEPKCCKKMKLVPYQEMVELVKEARIVVTHGGPSSFIMPLQIGKVPIVVPRKKEYREHVNDHQVAFCRAVSERLGNIIVVENVEDLGDVITGYESIVASMPSQMKSNNLVFCERFANVIDGLFGIAGNADSS